MSLSLFTAFILKSILSDMSITTPAFFWSLLAWNIFFQPFTFSLYVSFVLRWVAQRLKRLPAMQETQVRSLSWEDPLEKEMATTPVFLPGESHGERSLVGYSPRGRKESDMTEQLYYLL